MHLQNTNQGTCGRCLRLAQKRLGGPKDVQLPEGRPPANSGDGSDRGLIGAFNLKVPRPIWFKGGWTDTPLRPSEALVESTLMKADTQAGPRNGPSRDSPKPAPVLIFTQQEVKMFAALGRIAPTAALVASLALFLTIPDPVTAWEEDCVYNPEEKTCCRCFWENPTHCWEEDDPWPVPVMERYCSDQVCPDEHNCTVGGGS